MLGNEDRHGGHLKRQKIMEGSWEIYSINFPSLEKRG